MIAVVELKRLVQESRGTKTRGVGIDEELARCIAGGLMGERSLRDMPGPGPSRETMSTLTSARSMTKDFLQALEQGMKTGEVDGDVIERMLRNVRMVKDIGRARYGM